MAYDDIENSEDQGRPIRLYVFRLSDKVWRYTSADEDLTIGGFDFKSVAISDDGVKQSGEANSDTLSIRTESSIAPAQIFMAYAPSMPMTITILRGHEGDSETEVCFVGEISQHNNPQPGTSVMTCETLSASMRREGLRLTWQRTCDYALYDELTCRVPKEDYAVDAEISNTNDDGEVTSFELAGFAAGTFNGGFIEWVDPDRGIEMRGIEEHLAGGVIRIFGTLEGLGIGMQFKAYPGCARTPAACKAFNNYPNYGGHELMPGKSPFDGDPVFN